MNVETGAEAVLFPEKEYIKGIFVAVHSVTYFLLSHSIFLSTHVLRSPCLSSYSLCLYLTSRSISLLPISVLHLLSCLSSHYFFPVSACLFSRSTLSFSPISCLCSHSFSCKNSKSSFDNQKNLWTDSRQNGR
jgi:hypothetical protein